MSQQPANDSTGAVFRQVVHSPDAVALELPLAGPTSRILAYAIDAAILYTGLAALLLLTTLLADVLDWLGLRLLELLGDLGNVEQGADPGGAGLLGFAILILIATFAEVAYFVTWELLNGGQSPGKRVLALKVMRDGGLPLSFGASLARNVLRLVDVLPSSYLAGLISIVVSPEGKRLGDHAAGTIVVRLDQPRPEPPLVVSDPADARFRFRRDHIARLGDAEGALIRQTLRRLEELPADQADAALERSVEVVRARIGFEEAVPAQDRAAFLRALWSAMTRRRLTPPPSPAS